MGRLSLLLMALGVVGWGAAPPPLSGAASSLTLAPGKKLAVIGVQLGEVRLKRRDLEQLKNGRFGFGLNSLLAEAFYDAGTFQLIDENIRHKQELIEDLVHTYWVKHREAYPKSALRRIATQLETELLAYGRIRKIRFSRQTAGFGLLSHNVQKLRVSVEVCLYAVVTESSHCGQGRGEAKMQGTGFVYILRDNRLDFEKTGRVLQPNKPLFRR